MCAFCCYAAIYHSFCYHFVCRRFFYWLLCPAPPPLATKSSGSSASRFHRCSWRKMWGPGHDNWPASLRPVISCRPKAGGGLGGLPPKEPLRHSKCERPGPALRAGPGLSHFEWRRTLGRAFEWGMYMYNKRAKPACCTCTCPTQMPCPTHKKKALQVQVRVLSTKAPRSGAFVLSTPTCTCSERFAF